MKLCSAGRLNSSNLAQCVNGTEALGGAGPNLIQSSLTRHDENGMASASILNDGRTSAFYAGCFRQSARVGSFNGQVLWHSRPGGVLNDAAPMTYEIDGIQYVLTGVDGVMYAWTLSGSL
jgi:hypothetical protein